MPRRLTLRIVGSIGANPLIRFVECQTCLADLDITIPFELPGSSTISAQVKATESRSGNPKFKVRPTSAVKKVAAKKAAAKKSK